MDVHLKKVNDGHEKQREPTAGCTQANRDMCVAYMRVVLARNLFPRTAELAEFVARLRRVAEEYPESCPYSWEDAMVLSFLKNVDETFGSTARSQLVDLGLDALLEHMEKRDGTS